MFLFCTLWSFFLLTTWLILNLERFNCNWQRFLKTYSILLVPRTINVKFKPMNRLKTLFFTGQFYSISVHVCQNSVALPLKELNPANSVRLIGPNKIEKHNLLRNEMRMCVRWLTQLRPKNDRIWFTAFEKNKKVNVISMKNNNYHKSSQFKTLIPYPLGA